MQPHRSRCDRESQPDSTARRIADFIHSNERLHQPLEIGFRHTWTSVANVTSSGATVSSDLVRLFKALGGGWSASEMPLDVEITEVSISIPQKWKPNFTKNSLV